MTQTTTADPVRAHAAHAALLRRLGRDLSGWRGCFGVALVIDGDVTTPGGEGLTPQAFVANEQLTWVTAVDVPVPWITDLHRPAHLVQVRRAALRYGAPTLDPPTVLREFDYWDGPAAVPDLPPELVLAANGLNNAMTSTAFAYRFHWQAHVPAFREYAGLPAEPVGGFRPRPAPGGPQPNPGVSVLLGDRQYPPEVVKNFSWVPRPWVEVDPRRAGAAFQKLRELGFTDAFRAVAGDMFAAGMPVVSPVKGYFTGTNPLVEGGVRYTQFNFREEHGARHAVVASGGAQVTSARGLPVFRGTQVGADGRPVPPEFYHWGRDRRWGHVRKAYRPEVLDLVLGSVFSSLFRQVGRAWAVPFAVLGRDVSYSFGEGGLWWDVSRVRSDELDFSLGADARVHVMPTIRPHGDQWDSFHDRLGATALDLTPVHPRFRGHALARQIRRFPRTADGRTGDAQGEVVPVAVVPGAPAGVLPELGSAAAADHVAAAPDREEWAIRANREQAGRRQARREGRILYPDLPDDELDRRLGLPGAAG